MSASSTDASPRSVASRNAGDTDLDAEGHVVTPGFIDGHTHMDAQVFWDELGTNSCWHGVTTVVMGHCGFTLAPASPDARELVVRNLERAEDIAPAALAAGIDWTWTSFAEYLDTLDRIPKGINYAANIGHSALRTYVMGERAFEGEATDDDLAAMKAELTDALHAGAYGFTTSRTVHHQTSDDRPVASRLASWDEVVQLVEVLGDLGAGNFQIVSDPSPPGMPDKDAQYRELSLATGVPVVARGDERCHARDCSTSPPMPARASGASPTRVGSARSRRSAPNCPSTGCPNGASFARARSRSSSDASATPRSWPGW